MEITVRRAPDGIPKRAIVHAVRDLFLLDPDVTFLNHGSYGACPRPVFERYQRWQRELEREPVEFLGRRLPGLLAEARAALASYVGARPDDLTSSRTQAPRSTSRRARSTCGPGTRC